MVFAAARYLEAEREEASFQSFSAAAVPAAAGLFRAGLGSVALSRFDCARVNGAEVVAFTSRQDLASELACFFATMGVAPEANTEGPSWPPLYIVIGVSASMDAATDFAFKDLGVSCFTSFADGAREQPEAIVQVSLDSDGINTLFKVEGTFDAARMVFREETAEAARIVAALEEAVDFPSPFIHHARGGAT
jgi:hypothetical protein